MRTVIHLLHEARLVHKDCTISTSFSVNVLLVNGLPRRVNYTEQDELVVSKILFLVFANVFDDLLPSATVNESFARGCKQHLVFSTVAKIECWLHSG